MRISHITTLAVSLWQGTLSFASPTIQTRGVTCSGAEVNVLKCVSPSQYYVCPAPGQDPIIQNVAAGTECQNNALIATNDRPPNADDTSKFISSKLNEVYINMQKSSASPPPPTETGTAWVFGFETPTPNPSLTAQLTVPSGMPDPCRHGGEITHGTFDCSKLKNGKALIFMKAVHCLDQYQYTICGLAVNTVVCLLKDTMNRCVDEQVWTDKGLKVPALGNQGGRGP